METNIAEHKRSMIPMILTLGLLIIMASFITISRGVIHNSHKEVSIPTLSYNSVISDHMELNTSEQAVLTLLSSVFNLSEESEKDNTFNWIYFKTLMEFLNSDDMDLTKNQARNLKEKIIAMQEIIQYEGQTDYTKMSLDGRSVITYLLKEVYETCGISLLLDSDGNIERISNSSGNMLYIKPVQASYEGFRVEVLIITLLLFVILFSICYSISRKNQLFNKEVIYDGFDEERFA